MQAIDRLEEHIDYYIMYQLHDVELKEKLFAIMPHQVVNRSQMTTITGLIPDMRYAIRVVPHRTVEGKDYQVDISEAGIPSQVLVVRTLKGNSAIMPLKTQNNLEKCI